MNKLKKLKFIIPILTVVLLGGFFLYKKSNEAPKQIYDVVVRVRNQKSADPVEDKRSSMKKGDVLLVKSEGHKWSNTEKISYLILKMNLTQEQSEKLTQSVEKELSKDEIEKEMNQFKEGRDALEQEEIDRYKEELEQRRETVVLRKYRINMSKYFLEFEANDLIKGQPFQDEIYDWGIVEKK